MANFLLLVNVNIKISHHYNAPIRPNVLFASAELPGSHVTLHDIYAVFLVKRDTSDLIEADHVVLANESSLAGGIVNDHFCDRRFAARDQMSIRRDLLEKMALAGATRPNLHH